MVNAGGSEEYCNLCTNTDNLLSKKIEFLKYTHQNLEKTIGLADTKAGMTLALQGAFLAIGVSTPLMANVYNHVIASNSIIIKYSFLCSLIIFTVLSINGLCCTAIVYWPRNREDIEEVKTSKLDGFFLPIRYILNRYRQSKKHKDSNNKTGYVYYNNIANHGSDKKFIDNVITANTATFFEDLSSDVYMLSKIAKMKMHVVNTSIFLLIINICITIAFILLSIYTLSIQ